MEWLCHADATCAASSPNRHATVADRLIELLGNPFDTLSCGIEGSNYSVRCGLGSIRSDMAGILQRRNLLLIAAHFSYCFCEFIGQHQRCHYREARVADFTKLAAQIDDALVDVVGQRLKVLLLTIFTGKAILAAGNGGVDLRHWSLIQIQHRLN